MASAQAASLRYINDTRPGIRRKRVGRHFRYLEPDGSPVLLARAVSAPVTQAA